VTGAERLTVVIPNRGTPDDTIKGARSLIAEGVPAGRIVIVDDASEDDSIQRFAEELAACAIVGLDENVGFARAVNAGARHLPGDHYLVLNSDAFVHRAGSIESLLGVLADERVGIVAPRLVNEDLSLQPSVVPAHSPGVAIVRASGLSRLIPNRWQPRWSTHWDHLTPREVDSAVGAALLVRGSAWEQLGGYDESALMYAEDHDLCWRARKEGWKVWFTPEAVFVHLGSRSTTRLWSLRDRSELVGRSEGAMIRRQLPKLSAALTLAFMCAGLAARWLVFAVSGKQARKAETTGFLKGLLASARKSH
jgi:GT2 family glycosyltransferase